MSPLEQVKRALEADADVRLAVLFGSTARGKARRDSDLDVGVLLPVGRDVRGTLQVTLERASGREVSVVLLNDAPPLLRFEIARDGAVLVERETGAWARFRAHAMIDWWDWAPTARMMHRAMAARLRDEAKRGPA
jgi:predicted nucleotidyltransferase